MRLGIVSHIHCNIDALDRALEAMHDVDEILCAGDACYQFRFSNEVAQRLRQIGARYVLGNHEEILLSADGQRAQASPQVDSELLEWTRSQPSSVQVQIGARGPLMFHATPWEPNRDYVFPGDAQLQRFAEEDADFVVYGHTHAPLVERVGSTLIVNPGSVGEPRGTQRRLTYAVLDTDQGVAEVFELPDHDPQPS